jgi:hypothetical protein
MRLINKLKRVNGELLGITEVRNMKLKELEPSLNLIEIIKDPREKHQSR